MPGLGSFPLAKVIMGIGVVLLIAKWKRLPKIRAVATPFLRTAVALAALAVITAPFSIWPGMTFRFFLLQLPVIAAAVIVCCKISYTWERIAWRYEGIGDCRRRLGTGCDIDFPRWASQCGRFI